MIKLLKAKVARFKKWLSQKWEDYQCRRFNIESYDRMQDAEITPIYDEECGCDKCNCKKNK